MLSTAASALFGTLLGYLIATLSESFFHKQIGHASPWVVRLWKRLPRLCGGLLRAYYSHQIIHHLWTFRRDFVTQFESESEKQAITQRIPGRYRRDVESNLFGTSVRGAGLVWFVLPATLPLVLVYFAFDIAVFFGALFPVLVLFPMMSRSIHPWVHKPSSVAVRDSPLWLRWFMKTWYFRAIQRHHFLHHRHGVGNYNLLLGGDFFLGEHRRASNSDVEEMTQIGISHW